ncbi:MAG TPA: tetratricopeptide repeat protein [Candidatus Baltobacteraceae bacterium]
MRRWRSGAVLGLIVLAGCAGPVQRWIVDARVHQGDAALQHQNVQDAESAYQLALRVDPTDVRARQGFVAAAAAYAQVQFEKGELSEALATLDEAAKYDPASVRVQALRAAIAQGQLNREIVISNYPTYSTTGQQIEKAFVDLNVSNKTIVKRLQRFNYTYDTQDLSKAIEDTYDLQQDVTRNLNHLIAYRQLVESGVPADRTAPTGSTGSLLPLP